MNPGTHSAGHGLQQRQRHVLLLVAVLVVAIPTVMIETQRPVAPDASSIPPLLDRSLRTVSEKTGVGAHILVVGETPALVFFRATVDLYPRVVYTASPIDFEHGWSAPHIGWPALVRLADRDRAHYIFIWHLPMKMSSGVALMRENGGVLVKVPI